MIWRQREQMDRMKVPVSQLERSQDGRSKGEAKFYDQLPDLVGSQQEEAMTHAERRIVEFLITSNPTEVTDLPDWFLALVEGDGGEGPSDELITAASLMFVRRERPGIKFGTARRILLD